MTHALASVAMQPSGIIEVARAPNVGPTSPWAPFSFGAETGRDRMNVVVFIRDQLRRLPIARSLGKLGARVHEVTDLPSLASLEKGGALVIDPAERARMWRRSGSLRRRPASTCMWSRIAACRRSSYNGSPSPGQRGCRCSTRTTFGHSPNAKGAGF